MTIMTTTAQSLEAAVHALGVEVARAWLDMTDRDDWSRLDASLEGGDWDAYVELVGDDPHGPLKGAFIDAQIETLDAAREEA